MKLEYICEFVHLAEVGNFLNASEDLFISQSSLSKHIKAIEEELNTPLFLRTTRKVTLTEAGQVFLKYAKTIAFQKNEYENALKHLMNAKTNTISLGVIPSMAHYDITDIVYTYQRENPDMKLTLTVGDSYELSAKLEDGLLDMAFIRESNTSVAYKRIFFKKDKLVAVIPKKNKLADKMSIKLTDLENEDLCLLAENTMQYDLCKREFEKNGIEMHIFYQGHHLSNIADFVVKGNAIALLTEGQTKFIRNPLITIVDISPEIQTEINLCYKPEHHLSHADEIFIKTVTAFISNRPTAPFTPIAPK